MILSEGDARFLIEGAGAAVALFVASGVVGVLLGAPMGILRAGKGTPLTRPLRGAAAVYSYVFRGVPVLIQVLFVFYGTSALGLRLDRFAAGVIALAGYSSASFAEVFRASVDSVPEGQWHASRSVGMSTAQALREIILPQGLRLAVPPSIGFAAQLLKSTSIASAIGFFDLTFAGGVIAQRTREPLFAFAIVGLVYFALAFPMARLGGRLERRLRFAS